MTTLAVLGYTALVLIGIALLCFAAHSTGNQKGHKTGHDEGRKAGHDAGYAQGYADDSKLRAKYKSERDEWRERTGFWRGQVTPLLDENERLRQVHENNAHYMDCLECSLHTANKTITELRDQLPRRGDDGRFVKS